MNTAEAVRDLIEEAKVRTLYWAICVFAICYFLSHTSKSMWMNIPISLLLVSALRILSNSVEFCWRVQSVGRQTYLSHLVKKQVSASNSCLLASSPPHKWKRKIGCPAVESAVDVFVNKIMQDFVINLWYSDITPDKEAPELIDALIKDVLGEISGRVKELNIVELLTRDVVDLIGDHLDLFRRNQLAIGTDVISTLSTEERDERLKHHLIDSKELHPALISPECEYKVLQQLVGGILGVVLRPREAQCPLVRCIARELVASLVLQPVMNLACPAYINELIESIFLAAKHTGTREAGHQQSMTVVGHQQDHSAKGEDIENVEYMSGPYAASNNLGNDKISTNVNDHIEKPLDVSGTSLTHAFHENSVQLPPADWARGLDAATQRRTEVLMPENLEDMWSRGKKYKSVTLRGQAHKTSGFRIRSVASMGNFREEVLKARPRNSNETDEHALVWLTQLSEDLNKELPFEIPTSLPGNGSNYKLKRSSSTSALKSEPNANIAIREAAGINSKFYNSNSSRHEAYGDKDTSNMVLHREALHGPKLRCRVLGAYFEKIGSKSFAVYYIEVSDSEANTWFVKRRYRNFERLHRQLKGIPNYILHLPPKRIFSSSTEDAFVHQRCIQLDKYLKDLLSIANVAEQHDVWDFLSDSSKNYSFGNPSSVMRTLAVNVDDAVDENLRQFKEVSNGLVSKVKASPHSEARPSVYSRNLSWHADDISKNVSRQNTMDTENSFSDNEEGDEAESHGPKEFRCSEQVNRWHSDNELDSKSCTPRVIKSSKTRSLDHRNSNATILKSDFACPAKYHSETFPAISDHLKDPPEWTPPNVSVPLLNLVDKLFQLKKRGWLRRQVFWISKQILQLAMEDAIDDFLLRQINWLRREEVIAQGIRWVQDVLWPNGTFFLRLTKLHSNTGDFKAATRPAGRQGSKLGSFEAQLEASRRASDVKKIIFDGAPATLVSLIGYNQYNRSAKDVYYFLQSTVCVKQLAYGILEVALTSVFPELRDLIVDIHIKMRPHCA